MISETSKKAVMSRCDVESREVLSHPGHSWVRGRSVTEDAGIRQELSGQMRPSETINPVPRGTEPEQINCDLCQNVA